jgi:hypothetical protein
MVCFASLKPADSSANFAAKSGSGVGALRPQAADKRRIRTDQGGLNGKTLIYKLVQSVRLGLCSDALLTTRMVGDLIFFSVFMLYISLLLNAPPVTMQSR